MKPRVWINAEESRHGGLAAAVTGGGGVVSSPETADAIVWARDDPPSIRPHLGERVRWVQLASAGIEDWFGADVIARERIWTGAQGVYGDVIAEYCVGMLLAGVRRFPAALRSSTWTPQAPGRFAGCTVAIIGAGGIGRALTRLLVRLDVRVIAVTRRGSEVPGAERSVAADAVDEIIALSDAVVLAAPVTPDTVGPISADRLERMRPGALLVNVGRGRLVDTDALVAALRTGRLGGAFLDVTEPEPLPDDHPLWSLPNAVVTSHSANTQALGATAFAERVRENVRRFASGDELLGIVDPDAGY